MPGFAASMSASATVSFNGPSGAGASSAFGGGGQAALNAVGNAATGFGAGGGGSQNYNGSANTGGGAGTAGIVVITEFVNI
jgi:3-phosphoglycerate kinase